MAPDTTGAVVDYDHQREEVVQLHNPSLGTLEVAGR
jgi:hypothetical protein